ncbi:MAG TPA: sensor histidine kinase [Solirubrobacteraceae bacterium]|nr:sensor histidine kinase [Solirubrobacteraceae bacterium]
MTGPSWAGAHRRSGKRLTPLFWRVLITNTVVLFLAPLAVGYVAETRGNFAAGAALVVAAHLLVLWVLNFYFLRGAFTPLRKLQEFADRVDLLHPGRRLELKSRTAEVVVLTDAINRMLARLEHEQRSSTRRAVAAQESERKRIAQELHDEVGQTLTAVLLELDQAARRAPDELRERLRETMSRARASLEDVRRIAVELRPEALDELGLPGALITLCDRFGECAGIRIERDVARDLPGLTEEKELVIYRIGQEALTNVARHSGSEEAHVSLRSGEDGVWLEVADEGHGLTGAAPGTGVIGMRERANLVGASLSIADGPERGTIVRLVVPAPAEADGA